MRKVQTHLFAKQLRCVRATWRASDTPQRERERERFRTEGKSHTARARFGTHVVVGGVEEEYFWCRLFLSVLCVFVLVESYTVGVILPPKIGEEKKKRAKKSADDDSKKVKNICDIIENLIGAQFFGID